MDGRNRFWINCLSTQKKQKNELRLTLDNINRINDFVSDQPTFHKALFHCYHCYSWFFILISILLTFTAYFKPWHDFISPFIANGMHNKITTLYLIAPLALLVFNLIKAIFDDLALASSAMIAKEGHIDKLFVTNRNILQYITDKEGSNNTLEQERFVTTASTLKKRSNNIKQKTFTYISFTSILIAIGLVLTLISNQYVILASFIILLLIYLNILFLSLITFYNSWVARKFTSFIENIERLEQIYNEDMASVPSNRAKQHGLPKGMLSHITTTTVMPIEDNDNSEEHS